MANSSDVKNPPPEKAVIVIQWQICNAEIGESGDCRLQCNTYKSRIFIVGNFLDDMDCVH